ncbi:hypothetical protein [Parvularcula marina]|uniref:hypothetical protein n=2 Tax=Parvularcula marina TaxID=2292771 RepID=UPI003559E026
MRMRNETQTRHLFWATSSAMAVFTLMSSALALYFGAQSFSDSPDLAPKVIAAAEIGTG